MEFVAGQTLAAWAESGPRPWQAVLAVLVDVARGVAAAHEAGLVHRDLKPDNVMIGRDGPAAAAHLASVRSWAARARP